MKVAHKNRQSSVLPILDHQKIVVIAGLLLMGLTLVTGIAVYSVMRQQIELSLGRGLDVALQGKAHLLESQIEDGLTNITALATRPFLAQVVEQLNIKSVDSKARGNLNSTLYSLTQTGFSAIAVYGKQGDQLSKVGHFSEKKTQALPLNMATETVLIWDSEFILHSNKEIIDQHGRPIGKIMIEKKLPQLTRSFSEIRSIGETGTFMLCALPIQDSHEMPCLISRIDGIQFKYLMRIAGEGVLPMSYALDGKRGVVAVKDYRAVPVIEAYAPLETIDLGMILKLDEAELFKPITEELKTVIVYLALLIIVEILLLNWFVRKLMNSERIAQKAKKKAEQFSLELSIKESELRERLKEITCLYEIRRNIGADLSVDEVCRQIFRYLIPAMQYPEVALGVVEIGGNRIVSGNQIDDDTRSLTSIIEIKDKSYGQLSVLYPKNKFFLMVEEQKLLDAVAADLANWLERRQIDELLRERLKEITCLYEIRRGINLDLSIEKVCQNIFDLLIPAMQFPKLASVVIDLDGQQFRSEKKNQSHAKLLSSGIEGDNVDCYKQRDYIGHTLRSDIQLNGEKYGYISVSYPEDKPFLIQEEQKLIGAIAGDLESWLERKRLEQALVSVAEEQAHILGQTLHDDLGQQVAAIGYQISALERKIGLSDDESMRSIAASIASQVQTAVIQIKQLAQGLLPFELEANGLAAALEKLAARIAKTYSITCNFSCDNGIRIYDKNLALNFYRITQEAANNAIRHGAAQHLTVSLLSRDKKLLLSICDDGCGFSADIDNGIQSGMGIKIMQYRARQLGARLSFLSRSEGGAEVRLEMEMV